MRSASSTRRGFTVTETVVALVIVSILATGATLTYRAVFDQTAGLPPASLLTQAAAGVQQAATTRGGFPTGAAAAAAIEPGVAWVDGEPGVGQVSVARADVDGAPVLVLTTADTRDCFTLAVGAVNAAGSWATYPVAAGERFPLAGASCAAANQAVSP
jgi:prepilin-type N-terminal cleavage/methylation domain-containing protein